jgi:predicted NUDIX family phosphoesterase
LTWIGYIRDDGSAVARVHFGVVYAANTADRAGLSDEGKMIDAEIVSWPNLKARIDEFEGWSRHVIRAMAEA